MRESRKLERIFKGVANHRRIEIIWQVKKIPGITLLGISENLGCDFRTISEHTKKLTSAGLVNKKYTGRMVTHQLSPFGEKIYVILKKF